MLAPWTNPVGVADSSPPRKRWETNLEINHKPRSGRHFLPWLRSDASRTQDDNDAKIQITRRNP